MKALVYHRSVPRYLLSRLLGRIWPRKFFAGIAPLRLRDVPFSPPGPEWITLRPRLCGICGSDLGLLHGSESMLLEPYSSFPAVLGHEVVAEVASAPEGSGFGAGDRVVVEPVLSCGVRGLPPCRFCAQGHYNLCENFTAGGLAAGPVLGYNSSVGGGMAEFMAAHPSRLIPLPEGLADETAILVDSMASALQPVLDHFPGQDETVVVYGAGILGQHIVRILRALGSPARVVVVVRHRFQADLALAGGADEVLTSPGRNKLAAAVGGRMLPTTLGGGNIEGGADLFFDCVGSSGSFQEGLLALRARGSFVMVATAGTLGPVDVSSLWLRELRVTGSSSYASGSFEGRSARTYQMAVDLLARGDYGAEGLLSHLFPLDEYARALQTAFDKRRSKSVKVAIDLRGPAC